ncbi:hypothetical protein ACIQU3_28340 [Streptomyces sp. NPDC101110]|uniref:hypothetical protein n=1 Tax=unclassified Streptomyces TaxID=2593676 RepID=UPI00382322EA
MNDGRTQTPKDQDGRRGSARGPWAVLCAAVTVVLGPAAVTASALDQANAAPLHHAVRTGQTHPYTRPTRAVTVPPGRPEAPATPPNATEAGPLARPGLGRSL